jgi:hypothetical protein
MLNCKTEKWYEIYFSGKENIKETFIYQKYFLLMMNKRGQLGIIEFKFFLYGIFLGIILALVLVFLGTAKVLPFQIPLVCG